MTFPGIFQLLHQLLVIFGFGTSTPRDDQGKPSSIKPPGMRLPLIKRDLIK
ncbi:hypothetical protein NK553_18425 [Pseudomonas sp. ZM23]|uniref:Uncharacterized protein n=1 Tax=Pseudomonas triclosanedens TaxID=2961893 RepID=A0ABY6ZR93_9PSED|nr:hypothetical protein [Pseudomonas triclosanedens]MCP8465931.1 hypothetical protein [Pseudomonas triclosanedens]MCP8472252.1 hypothetical protein [Pseudomonas triclosanedens]MCP8477230.1 hypothetical protein [Pseudomonas triclosanedens]WAI47432.1 hypothetical protein OU419_16790 [Pseudomonas triclosanedens]